MFCWSRTRLLLSILLSSSIKTSFPKNVNIFIQQICVCVAMEEQVSDKTRVQSRFYPWMLIKSASICGEKQSHDPNTDRAVADAVCFGSVKTSRDQWCIEMCLSEQKCFSTVKQVWRWNYERQNKCVELN